MEQLPKSLIGFFASFISSHAQEPSSSDVLVKKLLSMKSVQNIIIKAMCKLEPIVNDQIIHIRSPKSPKGSTSALRRSRLQMLSQDAKNLMNNYENIQGKISSMLNIVDSIDFTIEHKNTPSESEPETQRELVSFLSALTKNKNLTNDEIEEISDDVWSKHMEVEKMLKAEMAKYYSRLDAIESKHTNRLNQVKLKSGQKINRLEQEISETWNHFRLVFDRVVMADEDRLSQEFETHQIEQELIEQDQQPELQFKDYNSALIKIKSLFAVKKILEKRKRQDEKFITGLTNKSTLLTEKLNDLKEMNSKMIENMTSLSWCLEFMLSKFEMPAAVKEKSLKLLNKQKCVKLEALFKVEGIFEKYSAETISLKFDELKEGIQTVSNNIKDENVKIKLSRLIIDSKLDEVDKTEALKNIQVKPPIVRKPRAVGQRASIKKEIREVVKEKVKGDSSIVIEKAKAEEKSKQVGSLEKIKHDGYAEREKPKVESALERMRKAMYSIDEEIKQSDKIIEDSVSESGQMTNASLYEISVKEDEIKLGHVKSRSSRINLKSKASPKASGRDSKVELYSLNTEEFHTEDKGTQISCTTSEHSTQASLDFYNNLTGILISKHKKQGIDFKITYEELESLLFRAFDKYIKDKSEKNIQTDKESGILDFSTPNNTIIRGLMNKINTLKSSRNIKHRKQLIDSNTSENLIITKLGKPPIINNLGVFKTEIINESELSDESSEYIIRTTNSRGELLEKPTNSTLPLPNLSNFYKNYNKLAEKMLSSSVQGKEPLDVMKTATDHYKKEFELQAQIKGLKKMSFEDIQTIWEDVINRRIIEGEKDKISVYLRGYLGTSKFESEKEKIISMIESSKIDASAIEKHLKENRKTKRAKVLERWKGVLEKILEKVSLSFRALIKDDDTAVQILYKAARNIRFVKHRIPGGEKVHRSKKGKTSDNLIKYSSDKWSINSQSLSPLESIKRHKRKKLLSSTKHVGSLLRSKTPFKEKILSNDTPKLPYI